MKTILISGGRDGLGKTIAAHLAKTHQVIILSPTEDKLRAAQEETVCVGDANNYVHLFRSVGKKVAMGNATKLLKSQADEVCDTVDNDGLAKLIEEMAQ